MANLFQAHLTIVPAAGKGTRLGGEVPKAWVDLAGAPLVCTTLRRLSESGGCPAIVLVAEPPKPEWRDPTFYRRFGSDSVEKVVPGGETRHESVVRGLRSFPLDTDAIVLIHDAARPMVAASDIQGVLKAAYETGAAVGGWPLSDTMKRLEPGAMRLGESVPREGLFAVGTPQAFRFSVLEDALRKAGPRAKEATDEASLVQAAGHPVAAVPISRYAFKVTFPEELADAERIARLESEPALAH
jgi:2-C-methyl-D-erythritol 4-phosphate cytidylyltransferase